MYQRNLFLVSFQSQKAEDLSHTDKMSDNFIITDLLVFDVRFPTSLEQDGSDATHTDPDYSACYVVIKTGNYFNILLLKVSLSSVSLLKKAVFGLGSTYEGCGLAFTIGRGNELLKHAVDSLRFLVIGKNVREIQGEILLPYFRVITSLFQSSCQISENRRKAEL